MRESQNERERERERERGDPSDVVTDRLARTSAVRCLNTSELIGSTLQLGGVFVPPPASGGADEVEHHRPRFDS